MPKKTLARKKLYEKWFKTISLINENSNPKKQLIIYLKTNLNKYNKYILYLLTKKKIKGKTMKNIIFFQKV